jgi:hypothetical protein
MVFSGIGVAPEVVDVRAIHPEPVRVSIAELALLQRPDQQCRSDKVRLSAVVYPLGAILVIFEPSRPTPPIRPSWLKTKA